jgi:transketolase
VSAPAAGPLSQALLELAPGHPDLLAVSADVVKYTDLAAFAARYPDRVLNVGMAEQNLVAVAAGLAKAGFVPFATTFGVFATRRALDFIEIQAALNGANVKICGGLPGVMSTFGPTHQAIDDLAHMRAVPGLTVIDPCDAAEMRAAAVAAYHHDGPVYLRLLLDKAAPLPEPRAPFRIGEAVRLAEGSDVAIVASSFLVGLALTAAQQLAAEGISAAVLKVSTLRPFHATAVAALASGVSAVVTAENHTVVGGLASSVAEVLAREGLGRPLRAVGVQNQWGPLGSFEYVTEHHGLTASAITAAAHEALRAAEAGTRAVAR